MRTVFRPIFFPMAALALALSAFSVACSDDSPDGPGPDGGIDGGGADSGTIATPDGGGDGGDAGTTTTPSEAPLYALVSVPATAMGAPTTSYVIVTDKLTGELKTENAVLNVPGSAIAAGLPGGKRLFIGTNQGPLLTRYDLTATGTLAASGTVNFQARGVPSFFSYASNFQFIDGKKAYYLALDAAKVVIWDPDALALTGEISLPQIVRPDPANPGTNFTTNVTSSPIRRGDKIYFFISWDSRNAGTIKVAPAAAVVIIDTKTDTATTVVDEGTCGYTRDGVVSGDFIYLATEGAGTAVNYLNSANGAAPCMRRFNLVTQQFDPAYKPDLNALAGAPAGTLVVTPSGQALIYVLDKAAADPMIGSEMGKINNPRVLAVGALWRAARLTVGDAPKIELLNLPLASGSVLPHVLKEGVRVTATFDAQPQLREVTNDGVVATERVSGKLFGNTASIVQLR
jgi:hypothetical protein